MDQPRVGHEVVIIMCLVICKFVTILLFLIWKNRFLLAFGKCIVMSVICFMFCCELAYAIISTSFIKMNVIGSKSIVSYPSISRTIVSYTSFIALFFLTKNPRYPS